MVWEFKGGERCLAADGHFQGQDDQTWCGHPEHAAFPSLSKESSRQFTAVFGRQTGF
jgi:hypothetical protein